MLWIILTAAAAPLQVARNALQRGLVGDAGPWGATLVRFLFGLPFSLAMFAAAAALTPGAHPLPTLAYVAVIGIGALGQVGATAALLTAMRRSGFAVATFMQQASLPFGAVMGLVFLGDRLSAQGWLGVAVTTAGLAALSWPKRGEANRDVWGAAAGLASAACFGVALNAYRRGGIMLEPDHAIYAGIASVCVAQTLQTGLLVAVLAATRPQALASVVAAWRASLGAGFCGAAASACWFSALGLAPAGAVRAVGVIEAPIAAAAGRTLFKERLTLRQALAGAATAAGVVLTALA